MSRRHRVALVAAIGAGALLLGSCGNDDGPNGASGAETSTSGVPDEERPPTSFAELQEIFDPIVEPMGLELTRGALIDTTDDGYEVSEDGTHLALYVEPVDEGEWSEDTYVDSFYELAATISPYVFERWSALETYDICEEPPNAEDDRPEPFPETQVQLPRSVAESFDWANGDLVDLFVADLESDEVRIILGRDLREHPGIVEAQDEARQSLGAQSTTTSS